MPIGEDTLTGEDASHRHAPAHSRDDEQKLVPGARLSGADLSGRDMSNLDLSGADLSNADLSGARLINTKLTGAVLFGTKLERAHMLSADLAGADLTEAKAAGAILGSANLDDTTLFNIDLTHATLTEASLRNADLRSACLRDARLRGAQLDHAELRAADLGGADLSHASVGGADFGNASLRGAKMANITAFTDAYWIGVDISDVDFTSAYTLRRAVMDENYLHEFRHANKKNAAVYQVWRATSDCGRSLSRWAVLTLTVAFLFGAAYSQASIDYGDYETWLSPFYFSVVTLTTLGYGDVLPASLTAQIIVLAEVLIGYIMLGGLLSIFATKMGRRAE